MKTKHEAVVEPGETREVVTFAYRWAQLLDITGPLEVFTTASRLHLRDHPDQAPLYRTGLVSFSAGPVTVSGGIQLVAERSYRDLESTDTLLVPGAESVRRMLVPEVFDWLRAMVPTTRRLCSVCTGALILAEAGLLKGRRATTHWESCAELQSYDEVEVEGDSIYVRDGDVYTSAGITAGIDLALALVEEDHGRALALATARELVVFLHRPGGQSQFSTQLMAQIEAGEGFDELLPWIYDHLDQDLRVEALAERVHMSPRNFARVFRRRIGMTPARLVELARLEAARRQLEESDVPLKTVARDSGFGTVERMRRSFTRHLKVRPSDYRRTQGR